MEIKVVKNKLNLNTPHAKYVYLISLTHQKIPIVFSNVDDVSEVTDYFDVQNFAEYVKEVDEFLENLRKEGKIKKYFIKISRNIKNILPRKDTLKIYVPRDVIVFIDAGKKVRVLRSETGMIAVLIDDDEYHIPTYSVLSALKILFTIPSLHSLT